MDKAALVTESTHNVGKKPGRDFLLLLGIWVTTAMEFMSFLLLIQLSGYFEIKHLDYQ